MNLYVTADHIGIPTGGGQVTYHESEALKEFTGEDIPVICRDSFGRHFPHDPFEQDALIAAAVQSIGSIIKGGIAHLYSGCLTLTVKALHDLDMRIVYTAAAHNKKASQQEHEKLGFPYPYPHLTQPDLWDRYIRGYLEADHLVCPSKHSAEVMRSFGAEQPITIVPHGCTLPERSSDLPSKFTVGYLGAVGPDKGLVYLLQAWGKLGWRDATLLLAGKDSTSEWVADVVKHYCLPPCSVKTMGWVKDVKDFYEQISLYVQPSVTEGFGIEVLESMAHGRPVICSTGAGAVDVVPDGWVFPPCDPDALVKKLQTTKMVVDTLRMEDDSFSDTWCKIASRYSWDVVRDQYKALWRKLQ